MLKYTTETISSKMIKLNTMIKYTLKNTCYF